MEVEQIYTGCLAQGAYYIISAGEAAIIDPLREVTPYLDRLARDGVQLKYIFETHFYADFVSGHITLSEKTEAPIVYGPLADPKFTSYIAKDGEEFRIGEVTLKALHTPGHTMESTTYLLIDNEGKQRAIFSGDTLFLGDVGRPDLAQKESDLTIEDLAGYLYDSLRQKIMVLDDDLLVYPAHGAGSACGKNMMKQTVDTLGNQKSLNYALRADMTKEEFISAVSDGLEEPPKYFPLNVKLNKEGYESLDQILKTGAKPLNPKAFETAANDTGALILDVRDPDVFAKGFIPNSINIGLNGSFAPWVGALVIDIHTPILLVVDEDLVEEAITRLSRVGFDNTIGFLEGGMKAWQSSGRDIDQVQRFSASEYAKLPSPNTALFDVRKPTEYASHHVDGALSTPLSQLNDYISGFPRDQPFHIHCAGGYRSMIAASLLKSRGFDNVADIEGGIGAMTELGLPIVESTCTTSN
ncbi:MAG: MBL fold metallo-hydrolase [Bacteroidota bacterium]